MEFEISGLVKAYRGRDGKSATAVQAVRNISFSVGSGQVFTLLGPSGCGKTTTLRCVAGLERPDAGRIRLGQTTLFSSADSVFVPAHRRGLGMVFQSYAVWPHMSVAENVAYPLTAQRRAFRPTKALRRDQVHDILSVVGLADLAKRRATELSGGQQQRLALARALVAKPPALLLDEPLSNLDAKLRNELRSELVRIQREVGVTSIFVTHDQTEALAMSDAIAVMRDGVIEQIGTSRDVYMRPASRFIAEFLGGATIVGCVVTDVLDRDGDSRVAKVRVGSDTVVARTAHEVQPGDELGLVARPEGMRLCAGAADGPPGQVRGTVLSHEFLGRHLSVIVSVLDQKVRVECPVSASVTTGSDVLVEFTEMPAAVA